MQITTTTLLKKKKKKSNKHDHVFTKDKLMQR